MRDLAAILPFQLQALRLKDATRDRRADEPLSERSTAYTEARERWQRGQRPPDVRRVETAGLAFCFPADSCTEGSLSFRLANGWLPFEDLARVRQLVVGGMMLDIGANVGTTCIPRIALGDFVRAYAAEPHADNYLCLVGNVLDNGLEGRVVADRVAISSSSGSARLRVGRRIGTHQLLAADVTFNGEYEEVRALTLDAWVETLAIPTEAITFIKVDAQGWDPHVLAGAGPVLRRRGIVWQIEVSPPKMKTAGWEIADLVALVREHFSHVKDLSGHDTRGLCPSAHMADILAALPSHRPFTNLLLLNAVTPD